MNDTESSDRRPNLTTADLAASADRRERQRVNDAEIRRPGVSASAETNPQDSERAPLFDTANAQEFRSRWGIVQQGFVDDPAKAVRQGDELVAQVIKSLAETFAQQRARLEGKEGSTEDLRLALRRYRSFFDRLLSI